MSGKKVHVFRKLDKKTPLTWQAAYAVLVDKLDHGDAEHNRWDDLTVEQAFERGWRAAMKACQR